MKTQQNMTHLYEQRLNLQNATFSRIDHEDATVAIVYKITLSTGSEFILKICTRTQDYLRELYFLNYFANRLPVPNIIEVVPPQAGEKGAILMEYLPGALLKPKEFTNSLAHEIGVQLARIHLNRASGYGDLTQPDDLSPDPRDHFTLKFNEGLDECSNHLPKELIKQCRNYFYAHLNLLNEADGPCIIHRDFRPGNLIVYDGKLEGIIDWSSARASFAQEDFCLIEHGDWQINPAGKKSFLSGYASVRKVPHYHSMMPLLRLHRAIAIVGFTVKRGTWKTSSSRVYEFNRKFLETFY